MLNSKIRATEVRLIDGDFNDVVPREEAERRAKESGNDLLIVSMDSSPIVVRLVDFGKFKYEQEKKQREAKKKQHVTTVKEIKMGVRIDDHDYETKVNRAKKFLEDSDKVKLTIRLKGREIQHSNLAFDLANQFVLDLEEVGVIEGRVRSEGRTISATFNPKPASVKKPVAKSAPQSKAAAAAVKIPTVTKAKETIAETVVSSVQEAPTVAPQKPVISAD
jgi:translation initiation factor IF-3